MGSLQYGTGGTAIEFSDRALLHIQIVITGKLRRRESFLFSWTDSAELGSGRSSIWLDPAIPLFYKFGAGHLPTVNVEWLSDLRRTADSGTGMLFTREPVVVVEAPVPLEPAVAVQSAVESEPAVPRETVVPRASRAIDVRA